MVAKSKPRSWWELEWSMVGEYEHRTTALGAAVSRLRGAVLSALIERAEDPNLVRQVIEQLTENDAD
jgi:hypothetical protein